MRRRGVLAGVGSLATVALSGCALPPGTTWWTECPTYDDGADRTVCSRTAPRPDLSLAADAVVYDYEPGPVPTEARFPTTLKNRTGSPVTARLDAATVYADDDGWTPVETRVGGETVTLADGADRRLVVRDAALEVGEVTDGVDVTVAFEGTGDYALVVPVEEEGSTAAVSLRFRFRD